MAPAALATTEGAPGEEPRLREDLETPQLKRARTERYEVNVDDDAKLGDALETSIVQAAEVGDGEAVAAAEVSQASQLGQASQANQASQAAEARGAIPAAEVITAIRRSSGLQLTHTKETSTPRIEPERSPLCPDRRQSDGQDESDAVHECGSSGHMWLAVYRR